MVLFPDTLSQALAPYHEYRRDQSSPKREAIGTLDYLSIFRVQTAVGTV